MATTYVQRSDTSDLSGGGEYSRQLLEGTATVSDLVIALAASQTKTGHSFTAAGVPGTAGITGNYTVEVDIAIGDTNVMISVAVGRVNSAGTIQTESSFTAEQAAAGAVLTFNLTSVNLGTWAAGDRLRVAVRYRNAHTHTGRNVTVSFNTVESEVVAPWTIAASQNLAGTLFTKAPTFFAGAITSVRDLAGVLFQKAPTFNVGAVASVYNLAGTLFQKAPTFPQGALVYYSNLVVVELDDADAPDTNVDHFLRAHARTDAGTGFIRLRLFQGASEIAELEIEPTGTFATYSYELLEAEAAAITDYNDLQIHIDVKATTTPFTPEIDWVDLQRPVAGVNLAGVLFQKAPTFPVGAITSTVNLAGVLYQNTPTFLTGAVDLAAGEQSLTGTLFTKAPTFSQGTVASIYNLAGQLFTKAPTFSTGSITATRNLAGQLFTKAPTFSQGTVAAGAVNLAGVLFTKAPTFSTGTISVGAVNLAGVLFQNTPVFNAGTMSQEGGPQVLGGDLFVKAPTFLQGSVTTGAVSLTGVLFQKAPTFNAGSVTATRNLAGVLFTKAPTFSQGSVSTGAFDLTGQLFTKAPTFPQGSIASTVDLAGQLFTEAPSFFTGTVTAGAVDLVGTLFQNTPVFFVGSTGVQGNLDGVLYQNAPVFFTGAIGQVGGSFWRPLPAGYTLNPVAFTINGAAFDPVLRDEVPPWAIEVDGEEFELAPAFFAGALS